MSKTASNLDLMRIGEQMDVVLTEIYGRYVAKGSPTKLGGLRFLDVESAKTFAFEKSRAVDDGNLLVLSAPFGENEEQVKEKLQEGPHAKSLRNVVVRASSDKGKGNKMFVEVHYYIDTPGFLTDAAIEKCCKTYNCNGGDAVVRLIKEHVLPVAAELMDYFIKIVRAETRAAAPTINSPFV